MTAVQWITSIVGTVTVLAVVGLFVRFGWECYEASRCWTFEPDPVPGGGDEYALKLALVRWEYPAVAELLDRIRLRPSESDPTLVLPFIVFNRHGHLIELSWCNVVATIRRGEIVDLDYAWPAADPFHRYLTVTS